MATQSRVKSRKHLLVDKANTVMMTTIAISTVICIFCIFGIRALFITSSYQNKVIKTKKTTLVQVRENSKNVTQLVSAYEAFATAPVNAIGGNPNGSGPLDGDNPRIVLDALPSTYDFPGLISSMEKLILSGGYTISSIGGEEEEQSNPEGSPDPQVAEIIFPMAVTTSYGRVQSFVDLLEKSIRPIYVDTITLSGTDTAIKVDITARTFYKPAKVFDVTNQEVK